MITTKRISDEVSPLDGFRVVIDRNWPRGIPKETVNFDLWFRDVAPSNGLRRWFNSDPEKWLEFKQRYGNELHQSPATVRHFKELIRGKNVTFLYAGSDERYNHALALKEYLESPKTYY